MIYGQIMLILFSQNLKFIKSPESFSFKSILRREYSSVLSGIMRLFVH